MTVYQVPMKRKKNIFEGMNFTTKLIIANVAFFVLFWVLNSLKILPLEYIALSGINIIDNFYIWTFLTSMFMHGGIFHLFVNMMSLFFVGALVERILGQKRYLQFYLWSGVFAGVFFVFFALLGIESMSVLAVGASGALFALIGILILLTPDLKVYMMFIPIPIKMKYAAPGMLIILWIISVTGDIPIGNVAHLGGLLAGLGYGLYLKQRFPNKVKMIQQKFR